MKKAYTPLLRILFSGLLMMGSVLAIAPASLAQDLTVLVSDLQSSDDALRVPAGNSLFERLESEYADIVPLVQPLTTSSSEQTRFDAIKLLFTGSLLSEDNAQIAAELTSLYIALAAEPSARVRVVAVEGLGVLPNGTPPFASPMLIALLNDSNQKVTLAAAHTLGRLAATSPEVTSALLTALNTTTDSSLRARAAEALGALNAVDDLVIAGLVNTLSDSNRNVRVKSINALLQLGGASISALAALQTVVLADPDSLVQELAASAIVSIENSNASPDCASAVASPNLFWPPDHKMVEVLVTGVNDPDGDSVTVAIESVTQDEAVNEVGGGNSCPDAIIDGDDTAMIRSERSGRLDGRIYRLNFFASDGKGGSCDGVVKVCMPHEESTVATCVEQPEEFDSTACP